MNNRTTIYKVRGKYELGEVSKEFLLPRFHWPDVRTKDLERSCGPDLINENVNDTQG